MCRNAFALLRVFEVSQQDKLTNGILLLVLMSSDHISENYLSYEHLEILIFGHCLTLI